MMDTKYSIQWNDPVGMGFWIRGIKPDGSFYGEIMYAHGDRKRSAGTLVEGQIPPADWKECLQIIRGIGQKRSVPDATHWMGQLASWTETIAKPSILFRYCRDDETNSRDAKSFLELKRFVERQLPETGHRLKEFSNRAHNKRRQTPR
jgi:hypothetical protein